MQTCLVNYNLFRRKTHTCWKVPMLACSIYLKVLTGDYFSLIHINKWRKTTREKGGLPIFDTRYFFIRLSPEFLPVSVPLTRWCASTLGPALLCICRAGSWFRTYFYFWAIVIVIPSRDSNLDLRHSLYLNLRQRLRPLGHHGRFWH